MKNVVSRITKLIASLTLALSLTALTGCDALPFSTPKPATPAGLLQTTFEYPAYAGKSYVVINDGKPFFTEAELNIAPSTEVYGDLDKLGRCTGAFAIVTKDTMPTSKRGSISSVHPTGWQHVEYSFVDSKSLYNRCHLIAWSLTDEEANDRNLVTGTRYMNTATVDFEQMACNYVRETGNAVAYRATPVFEGDNLVCTGILMEAESVADKGKDVQFCVFLYNVEPGVDIDYATGESQLAAEGSPTYSAIRQEGATVKKYEAAPEKEPAVVDESVQLDYVENIDQASFVLNVKGVKFHAPTCENALSTEEKNRRFTSSPREEVVRAGYEPAGCCKP